MAKWWQTAFRQTTSNTVKKQNKNSLVRKDTKKPRGYWVRNKGRKEEKECREDMSQREERGCHEKGERWGRGWEERFICLPKSHSSSPTSFHFLPRSLLLLLMDRSEIRGTEWKLSKERIREIHLSLNQIFAMHLERARQRKKGPERDKRGKDRESMVNQHGLPGLHYCTSHYRH